MGGSGALAHDIAPSGYREFKGDRFYVLADRGFSSEEVVKVRLEAANRGAFLRGYQGADIRFYRVPNPIDFLSRQRNLHRPRVPGNYRGEGAGNALTYLWDVWYKQSRLIWQRLFSSEVRREAVRKSPSLKQVPPYTHRSRLGNPLRFKPIPGLELVGTFRYPIWDAKPIQPPKNVALSGSSSNFITTRRGNTHVPLGRQKPGLYLVESIIGSFRATTLVFVSDSIAVSKTSSRQILIWSVHKKTGVSIPGTKILLTDGVGVINQGRTGKNGIYIINKKAPERSYIIGEDPSGGVFVSENFYFDSEFYQDKVYIVTDRPLYRPGDQVHVKMLGLSMTEGDIRNRPLRGARAVLTVHDSSGVPVVSRKFRFEGARGGDTRFRLPPDSISGGYSLRVRMNTDEYAGAFRVAEYSKPHFNMEILLTQPRFDVGEPVLGRIRLIYPSGLPVAGARIEIDVRVQTLAMDARDVRYSGNFPLQLRKKSVQSDQNGEFQFKLPAVQRSSRYIIRARAEDKGSYRVRSTKEVVIQGKSSLYRLGATRSMTAVGDTAEFFFQRAGPKPAKGEGRGEDAPTGWVAQRLEDRSAQSGLVDLATGRFEVIFQQAGSYEVRLTNGAGKVLGALSHWVRGEGLESPPGKIKLVPDREAYYVGETARMLIVFPVPVTEALITVERDRIEKWAFLSSQSGKIRIEKQSDTQWMVEIPVEKTYFPNVSLSVAYVLDGKFVFQNKGIAVKKPQLEVELSPERVSYRPGEIVRVDVRTQLNGKPRPAFLTVGVVNEAIYVLQPEIAPSLGDFFYHHRRNQVRTNSSFDFYTFDAAVSSKGIPPSTSAVHNRRALNKFPEGYRRDNVDTALWLPVLETGADGRASFTFTMPDSLARWRITARGLDENGAVGQSVAHLTSSKEAYLTWSGPGVFRASDQPVATLVAFNSGDEMDGVELAVTGGDASLQQTPFLQSLTLKSGSNVVRVPLNLTGRNNRETVRAELRRGGQVLDRLEKRLRIVPDQWLTTRSIPIEVGGKSAPVKIPAGAGNIRIKLVSSSSEQFLRIADDLMEYPHGGVELTASRLIPLSIVLWALKEGGVDENAYVDLQNIVIAERFRLIQMAGPGATFGWWGNQAQGSLFLTAYAYYADWRASRALQVTLPPGHWENLLKVYSKLSGSEPLVGRTFAVWMASEIGLPTRNITSGLMSEAARVNLSEGVMGKIALEDSALMNPRARQVSAAFSLSLIGLLAGKNQMILSPALAEAVVHANGLLRQWEFPLANALALLSRSKSGEKVFGLDNRARGLLASLRHEASTIDRALSLALVETLLRIAPLPTKKLVLEGPWAFKRSRVGVPTWHYTGEANSRAAWSLALPGSPVKIKGLLVYQVHGAEESTLPVRIQRKIYRLDPAAKKGDFSKKFPREPGVYDSNEVYLDEVVVTPLNGTSYKYGVLEIPLPPGADLLPIPYGMKVGVRGSYAKIPETEYQEGDIGYAIPVESLREAMTFQRLVRFSQAGKFTLPPARFYRTYQPNDKAFEEGRTGASRFVTVR